ncbi:hypothetical protein D5S17_03815 [Pseudonocardiaceae bacterium YIM PH 21723]|nr:hypothetical protein D5S17_03815 [Pseudonocardiaceae bacterium YIM PH 21723]
MTSSSSHVKAEIEYGKIIENSKVIADLDFDRCTFEGGVIMQAEPSPDYGVVVRNVSLTKCKGNSIQLFGVRFEDVTVDTFRHPRMIDLQSCVLKHVVLRGNVGSVRISQMSDEDARAVLAPAAAKLYEDVDWALDITEAEFSDAEFWDLPGHLVKRNPETQFLLSRAAAASADTGDLSSYGQIVVERAADSVYETSVAAAPVRSKYFEDYLGDLRKLRELGIAE